MFCRQHENAVSKRAWRTKRALLDSAYDRCSGALFCFAQPRYHVAGSSIKGRYQRKKRLVCQQSSGAMGCGQLWHQCWCRYLAPNATGVAGAGDPLLWRSRCQLMHVERGAQVAGLYTLSSSPSMMTPRRRHRSVLNDYLLWL